MTAALLLTLETVFVVPGGHCAVSPFREMHRELGTRGVAMFSCNTEVVDQTGDGVPDRSIMLVFVDRKGREVCHVVIVYDGAGARDAVSTEGTCD